MLCFGDHGFLKSRMPVMPAGARDLEAQIFVRAIKTAACPMNDRARAQKTLRRHESRHCHSL